jgi:hypothetical protein
MTLEGAREDNQVVDVDEHRLPFEATHHFIHHALEITRRIGGAEGEYHVLV